MIVFVLLMDVDNLCIVWFIIWVCKLMWLLLILLLILVWGIRVVIELIIIKLIVFELINLFVILRFCLFELGWDKSNLLILILRVVV